MLVICVCIRVRFTLLIFGMGNSLFFSLMFTLLSCRDFDSLSKENIYENNKQVRYCSLYKIILSIFITFFSVISITTILYIYGIYPTNSTI